MVALVFWVWGQQGAVEWTSCPLLARVSTMRKVCCCLGQKAVGRGLVHYHACMVSANPLPHSSDYVLVSVVPQLLVVGVCWAVAFETPARPVSMCLVNVLAQVLSGCGGSRGQWSGPPAPCLPVCRPCEKCAAAWVRRLWEEG